MTDREPHALPARPVHAPARPEAAPEDDGPLMSVTLATCTTTSTAPGGAEDAASRDGPPATPHPGDTGRARLARLFAGEFSFPVIAPVALPPADRTPAEHDAAARAAGCPDLFVVHADPPAGERLIADLARAAAGTERVLVLSPNPAAADRVAERLARAGASVLRALADDENPVRPSPAVGKLTSAALAAARLEQLRREAAAAVAAAESRLAAFATVAKAVDRLKEVNGLLARLDAEVAGQAARRQRVEQDVRATTDPALAAALAKLNAGHAAAADRLAGELRAASASCKAKEAELADARRRHADATRRPGFFARLFGAGPRATGTEAAELEKLVQAREAEAAALANRLAESQAKVDAQAAALAAERDKLVAAEADSRCAALDSALAAAERERERVRLEAAALEKVIAAAVPGDHHADAERQLAAAREREAEVARCGPELAALAVAETRVVVGTPGSLEADPAFAPPSADPPFGLLVLDRAEELPEPEFDRLSRLAGRWVLVGNTIPRDEARPPPDGPPRLRPGRNGRPEAFAARLARLLDRQTWAPEGDRLVCRLSHPGAEERRAMTREPLADRPEIELRFVATGGEPLLAEIAFPAGTPVPAAKGFLFHELGEVLLRPCGEFHWRQAPGAITAVWPAADASEGVWIDLEPGVREKVAGAGLFAYTAAVSFDPSAGWDAEKAAAWLTRHLPPPSCGRFAALPRSPIPRAFAG